MSTTRHASIMLQPKRRRKSTFASLSLVCSFAVLMCEGWTVPGLNRPYRPLFPIISRQHSNHLKMGASDDSLVDDEEIHSRDTRREWFDRLARSVAVVYSSSFLPQPAFAKAPPVVTTASSCDATVSVWKLGNDQRLVYLLGTAHISEVSAQLAGSLVDDVHPNAVFVELDLKRIGQVTQSSKRIFAAPQERVFESSLPPPALPSSDADTLTAQSNTTTPPSRVIIPVEAPTEALKVVPPPRESWFQRKALNFASRAVGSALRGMYSNLNDAGFKPGEEFGAAIREGQKVGASIILGDQDVEVTLRKLTKALAETDLNRIADPESGYEKSMQALLPPSSPQVLDEDSVNYKEELAEYVERLKSRENVRKIMSELKEVAPALVDVMLTQRDAYMARGIDTLNEFDVIVAVMGIAHQDGVESNLQNRGWRQVRLPCPAEV